MQSLRHPDEPELAFALPVWGLVQKCQGTWSRIRCMLDLSGPVLSSKHYLARGVAPNGRRFSGRSEVVAGLAVGNIHTPDAGQVAGGGHGAGSRHVVGVCWSAQPVRPEPGAPTGSAGRLGEVGAGRSAQVARWVASYVLRRSDCWRRSHRLRRSHRFLRSHRLGGPTGCGVPKWLRRSHCCGDIMACCDLTGCGDPIGCHDLRRLHGRRRSHRRRSRRHSRDFDLGTRNSCHLYTSQDRSISSGRWSARAMGMERNYCRLFGAGHSGEASAAFARDIMAFGPE